jgi:flavin reductase (DIM6/NTAB) family NADH-FMN oxidoreductase RutF
MMKKDVDLRLAHKLLHPARLECKLSHQIATGDHTILVGAVPAAYSNERVFEEGKFDPDLFKLVLHLGGDDFIALHPEIIMPKTL